MPFVQIGEAIPLPVGMRDGVRALLLWQRGGCAQRSSFPYCLYLAVAIILAVASSAQSGNSASQIVEYCADCAERTVVVTFGWRVIII